MPRPKKPANDNIKAVPPVPLHGVTADNYPTLGNIFIGQGVKAKVPGIPFLILRDRDAIKNSDRRRDLLTAKITIDQWWAWRNFFSELGCPVGVMDQQGYYTVPAEWPHLFSAETKTE